MEVSRFSFFATKLFRVERGTHESAGQFIQLFQKAVAGFLILENRNGDSLDIKLLNRPTAGFNLHGELVLLGFEYQRLRSFNWARVSLSTVRFSSASRLSYIFFPRAIPTSILIRPFFK